MKAWMGNERSLKIIKTGNKIIKTIFKISSYLKEQIYSDSTSNNYTSPK